MRRSIPAVAVVLLTAGALTACTAAGSGGSQAAGSAVDFQSGRAGTASAGGSGSGVAGQAAGRAADRAVVTTGSLRLVAQRPIRVADRVQALVEQAGGSVGRSSRSPGGRAAAQLELRIPAGAFTRVLAAIEQQGEVRDVSTGATDVTARVTDYAVRIANLRTSIARLQGLLREADSSSALVTVERALTERQTSLEQLLGEQRELADQVRYATLTVEVMTPAAAPAKGPGDFLGAVAAGAQSLVQATAAALIGLGVALPWLAVVGAVTGGVVLVRRALRRRTRPTSA